MGGGQMLQGGHRRRRSRRSRLCLALASAHRPPSALQVRFSPVAPFHCHQGTAETMQLGSLANFTPPAAPAGSLGSLQSSRALQTRAACLPRRQRRAQTAVATFSSVKQVVVPLAATAALGGLLTLTVRRALISRQQPEPQQARKPQAAARRERREGGSAGGGKSGGGWPPLLPQPPSLQLPAWPGLHNKEQREERQLLSTVSPRWCMRGGEPLAGGPRCIVALRSSLMACLHSPATVPHPTPPPYAPLHGRSWTKSIGGRCWTRGRSCSNSTRGCGCGYRRWASCARWRSECGACGAACCGASCPVHPSACFGGNCLGRRQACRRRCPPARLPR